MILDRDFAKVGADELVSIGSPLLIELLNHASNAFIRVQGNASDEADIDIAPLCMYRHVMEMIDAVQVCVSQACAVGAIPALRTVFEASLSLEFVVQRDYSARARAWLFYTMRKKIDGMILSFAKTVAGLPQPVRPDEDTDGKVASGSVTSDSLMRRDFRRARIDAETRGLARGAWFIGGRYAGGRAGRYAARRS